MIYDQILPNDLDIKSVLGSKQPGTICLDRNQGGEMLMRQCRKDLSICDDARCFKKCCPDGQSFVGGGFCKDTFVRGIEIQDQTYSTYIEDPEDEYELIYGAGCPDVTIYPSNTIQYSITKDGVFKYYSNYSDKFIQELESDLSGYCIEHATKGSMSGYYVFRCFQNRQANNKFSFTLWAKIASCVFLVMTVALYFYLGETRSTFGKVLVSYCVAMFILMLVLILSMMKSDDLWCKIKGYLLIFFNCSTHAWVNVISYDIWGTFGSPKKTICVIQKKKNLRKFLNYCLYAWGIALVHMILLIILENTSFLPDSVQPRIGNLYCFIENVNYGRVVFLLVPYMVLQIINIVLFVRTAIYCIRVQNEIQKMNDTFRKNDSGRFILAKDRLTLLVKLAVVMGIIWLVELLQNFFKNMISYSEFTKTLEIVLDTITCCQGVFIFLIFICKKKILNLLKKKLGCISWTDSTSSTPSSESNIILQGRKASATTYAAENPILST
ncbi:G-protein coupled receptor Mth2-like [Sitophilus oryzae]|uniref:G-protein coupled receptor Mth2-like n=1 Tax=Sitophilus oryzae TaxID=7048 RepID=A0A6J2XIW5_SITOR|nr:G-protein coupled receptor Mth2-like [Sitophilus oryzae]